jgi:hypothetical protein
MSVPLTQALDPKDTIGMLSIRRISLSTLLAFPFVVAGSEPMEHPKADPAYGLTIKASVEVCDPKGEDEYLSRLICPAGDHPSFERFGSVGARNPTTNLSKAEKEKMLDADLSGRDLEPGETDYHIIDGFEVNCGESKATVYLDMYHCSSAPPTDAPVGFTIDG